MSETARRRQRIVVVSDEYPWPAVNGYRMRLTSIIEGLARVGDVELFAAVHGDRDPDGCVPPPGAITRQCVARQRALGRHPLEVARWLLGCSPRRVHFVGWGEARGALRRFAPGAYDLVWYSHVDAWAGLGGLVEGPAVVDLDNLEDEKLRALRLAKAGAIDSGRQGVAQRITGLVRRGVERLDERRWGGLQRAAATATVAAVVCSDVDRRRLGTTNATVVANGYEPTSAVPTPPVPRPGGAKILTMVGLFSYPPNADAAGWFVAAVWPLVRKQHPDALLRLVGRWPERTPEWVDRPGVVTVGEVQDVAPFLAGSDVCVVPIRYGSGTRVKVLEGLAHGLPVVSTTLGAEGIDVRNEENVLLADDATSFAGACNRLLADRDLAIRIGAAGKALWAARYRLAGSVDRVADLAVTVMGGRSAGGEADAAAGRPAL